MSVRLMGFAKLFEADSTQTDAPASLADSFRKQVKDDIDPPCAMESGGIGRLCDQIGG